MFDCYISINKTKGFYILEMLKSSIYSIHRGLESSMFCVFGLFFSKKYSRVWQLSHFYKCVVHHFTLFSSYSQVVVLDFQLSCYYSMQVNCHREFLRFFAHLTENNTTVTLEGLTLLVEYVFFIKLRHVTNIFFTSIDQKFSFKLDM